MKGRKRNRRSRPRDEASYVCPTCGESIVVPIDPSGVFPDGTKFDGPAAFRQILLSRQRESFLTTLVSRMLTYALGRGVEYYDMPVVRKLIKESAADDYRWSSLILGIVNSVPFQMSKGES